MALVRLISINSEPSIVHPYLGQTFELSDDGLEYFQARPSRWSAILFPDDLGYVGIFDCNLELVKSTRIRRP